MSHTCCWRNNAKQNIFAGVSTGVNVKFNAIECLGLTVLKTSNQQWTPENLETTLALLRSQAYTTFKGKLYLFSYNLSRLFLNPVEVYLCMTV